MNKTLFTLAIATLLFSCSKEDAVEEFQATNMTGDTVIQGKVTHSDYNSGNEIALEGATVTVRIDNDDLYPNSPNAQGSEVYTATSDADGNYSITAKTNGDGVQARITYSPVTLTVDPTTGEQQTYSNTGTTTLTAYKGVPLTNDVFYGSSTSVDISNIVVETAIVRGTVEIQQWVQQDSNTSEVYFLESLPLANTTVTLVYDQDPTTLQERTYEVTSDSNGDYEFTIETCDFDYDLDNGYEVILPVFDTTQDSISFTGVVLASTPGVFAQEDLSGSVQGGSVDNSRDLLYNNFTQD